MNKILILNITRMGDIIQSSQLVKGLKKKYKNSCITYVPLENFKGATSLIPEIDEVISLDFSNILKDIDSLSLEKAYKSCLELISEKKFGKYDLLINLSFSKLSGFLSFLIHSNEKHGLVYSETNDFQVKDKWSSFLLSIVDYRELSPFNLVDIYSRIGGVKSTPINETELKKTLKFGFVMGASTYDRMWPPQYFAQLAELILNNYPGSEIFLFGTKSEKKLLEKFFQFTKQRKGIIDLIGKTGLNELLDYIRKETDIVITNDTGTMHLAWYAGKKVVELSLGPALYNTTGPYGKGHIVIQPDIECAPCSYNAKCKTLHCHKKVSPEIVLEAVKYINGEIEKISPQDKVKVFESYLNNDKFVDYNLISGKDSENLHSMKVLKRIWLATFEGNLIPSSNIKFISKEIQLILSQIKTLKTVIKDTINLLVSENFNLVEEGIDIISKQEKEIEKNILTNYREFIPFLKFTKYRRNILPENDLEHNLLSLIKIYETLENQIIIFKENYHIKEVGNENLS